MQAALMLRAKSRERRKQRLKRGIKHELPSNVATKPIAPFPRYPPASWCAAGRAAWQEAAALSVGGGGAGAGGAARRCSVLGDHPGARRDQRGKWHRTNRVRDASYGSSSDSEGEGEGASGEPWGVARLLYAGLAILALGLVVYFVGTGDKGFKTPALRLVGPSLIVAGLACCLLRIMFCIFAKPCCRRRTNHKESRRLSGCVEGEEMPLARCAGARAGPAQCSPARRLDASSCDVSSLSSGEEDERLRRYRTANATTTHLQPQTVLVQPAGSQPKPSPSLQSTAAGPSAGGSGPAGGSKRPPPRNVSFAGAPDGELVLSPAQLRS
ncbi:uncharacterized protein LOC126770613 isoform X1 [Nymphalis io]|uniref:uncharacterized protein LOC126770613 isoform X1 n=1 Tax=Inachis io TaxID=171585 RepID=UPI00216A940D|nr:uncharacterized protein LOC126770613 isoform X1 [Nymphalis io]XP_050346054.1 uncharacterized protein LOC126770613 isoform X1 [Nymphalis io]